jgi:aspartate/methionine/tyrosine aminotransferase
VKQVNSIFAKTGVTVFETMSRLAMETGAINLGQGFPGELGPENLRRVAADAIMEGPNQYVRFCFSKRDSVLDAALDKLRDFFA